MRKQRKHKRHKKSEKVIEEIKSLIDELYMVHVEVLKGIRGDLIRARARIKERTFEQE